MGNEMKGSTKGKVPLNIYKCYAVSFYNPLWFMEVYDGDFRLITHTKMIRAGHIPIIW